MMFFEVGEYQFFQEKWGSIETLWGFSIHGIKSNELFHTLDEAMVAAIAQKHVGQRGAGGTAVGTAADWFFAMLRGWKK